VDIALFADGIDRASVSTCCAIDTLVINCVGHGTFLLLNFCNQNFWEFTATIDFCPAQRHKELSAKKLAISQTIH
jgi:hypothetical protein